MPNVRELAPYLRSSFKSEMNAFYSEILSFGAKFDEAPEKALTEGELKLRIMFLRRVKGRLIQLFRKKNGISIEEAAEMMGWQAEDLEKIESGEWPISEPQFYRLCEILGAADHVLVFLDMIELAIKPQLYEARVNLIKALKLYGFSPVLPQGYGENEEGKVLDFPLKRKSEPGGQP